MRVCYEYGRCCLAFTCYGVIGNAWGCVGLVGRVSLLVIIILVVVIGCVGVCAAVGSIYGSNADDVCYVYAVFDVYVYVNGVLIMIGVSVCVDVVGGCDVVVAIGIAYVVCCFVDIQVGVYVGPRGMCVSMCVDG